MDKLKERANKTVEYIRAKGVDKGQVFVTESEKREFNVENGEFTLLRTLFSQNLNVLVYKEQKKGTYAGNKLEDEDIKAAVETAITAAEAAEADEAFDIAPFQGELSASKGVYEPDTELLFDRTKEMLADIRENHPKIVVGQLIISHDRSRTAYANTNGTTCEQTKGFYAISIEISGHEGDKTTSAVYAGFQTKDLDKPFTAWPQVANALSTAEKQLEARPMEGKFTGTMVLTPDCLSTFLYYIAEMAGGSAILEKTSIWLDKLGQQIADKRITVSMNPEDERVVCGSVITNDGFKAEPYDFIKDGTLKTFILNYYLARKTGYERAKNDGFNVVIAPGKEPLQEMIKGIKKGILVGYFSGGQPGINGEFSGVAKNSFYIEDGQIKEALTETMINGNFAEMINRLAGISSEVECDGTCVLPYMAFDGIVISGK